MSRLRLLPRAVAVLAAAVVSLSACNGTGASGDGYIYRSATAVGSVIPVKDRKPAEDVKGTLLSGGSTSLRAYKGKVLVVTFWASWCGPCTVETPQFDSLYRKLKGRGVQVLGVNTKNVKGPAQAFVRDNDLSFPNIYDFEAKVLLQLGNIPSAALPVTVLIDKQQRVAAVYVSRLSINQVEPAIDTLAAETAKT